MTEKKKPTAEERKIFISQMKKYRLRQGMTLRKLSEKSGFDSTYLSSIESCRTNLTIDSASKIAKALHMPLFIMFVDIDEFINVTESDSELVKAD